ncbi:MAG: glycosyltransferase family 2 protein, partial [Candidatus Omnitrophota bacterium]
MKKISKYPDVSVIVVNHDGKHLLEECFSSLSKLDYPRKKLQMIMVDNCSADGSSRFIKKKFPQAIVLENRVNNYCRANNLGIERSGGDYVAVLNNDTRVDRYWLKGLTNIAAKDDRIGAVGSKILFSDEKIQSAGHEEFPYYYYGDKGLLEEDMGQYDDIQEVSSISNCSALYKRKALDDIGLFDEDFNMYMEDVDCAFRLKKNNWKIFYAPASKVYHKLHGSALSPKDRVFYIERNRLLFIAKYFPENLKANFSGHGEISRLDPDLFNKLLLSVYNKLAKHHGNDKASRIFFNLNDEVNKTYNYGRHVLQVEKDNNLKTELAQLRKLDEEARARDNNIKALRDTLAEKDSLLKELSIKLPISEDTIRKLHEEVRARDNHIKS